MSSPDLHAIFTTVPDRHQLPSDVEISKFYPTSQPSTSPQLPRNLPSTQPVGRIRRVHSSPGRFPWLDTPFPASHPPSPTVVASDASPDSAKTRLPAARPSSSTPVEGLGPRYLGDV